MVFNTTTEGSGPGETQHGQVRRADYTIPLPESMPPKTMPIAIIGMSCRFAGGATTPSKLWDLCVSGRSAWSPIPENRFNASAWHHTDKEHVGTSYVQGAHFLKQDVSAFDASFFNLSSEAAASMDPEVRLQLECVYEAFESAGLSLDDVSQSRTAVCAGTCFRDFHDSHMRDPSTLERTFLTGNGMAMIANRVSHFYNLTGPSIAVDTGCSTTLTLLHMACQSLRSGESEMAVVGGSNVLLNPDMFVWGTIGGLLSAEGRCFAFDSRASGYGRGEGAASLVLKPLEAAVRDGDPIRAVIRETAINQDGKTATLTSPSCEAQQQLMRDCYARSGLDPRNTGYVQAHGTGTQAGDSTEATALGTALAAKRPLDDPLLVGSVKTNIGHTEAASGLAGVIQTVLAIEHERIAPLINFEKPNPAIDFEDLRLKVPRSVESWPRSSMIRASVNNFGYGGSNAHAIIEHPKYLVPYYKASQNSTAFTSKRLGPSQRLLKLGAKDEAGVRAQIDSLKSYAKQHAGRKDVLDQLSYTLGQKRTHFSWNTAISISSVEEIEHLRFPNPQRSTKAPRIGFVFSGQGAQWFGMGRELLGAYPVFDEAIWQGDRYLQEFGAPWSLRDELLRDEASSRINEVAISLPASVAIQLAIVRLLKSWKIEPAGVTGHSSGEVAAAFAVGAIDMRSALAIVYTRGTLTTEFQKIVDRRGGMLAVGLSREQTLPYLASIAIGHLVIACINSPSSVTVSGDLPAIEELEKVLAVKRIFARKLRVDAAYHSDHMLGIADAYREALSKSLAVPRSFSWDIIYSSPVTGERLYSAEVIGSADHWVRNMVQPVEFLSSLTNMCRDPATGIANIDILLEVGPHAALKGPIRQTTNEMGKTISYTSCLVRGNDAVSTMQEMAANLVMSGYPVSLANLNFPHGSMGQAVLTDLDPYPWNHQTSHWSESRVNREHRKRKLPVHDLLGALSADSSPSSRRWRHIIRPSEIPWVRDHRFQSDIVYPGAGYMSMAIEAIRQTIDNPENIIRYELRDVDIGNALVILENATGKEVHICLEACGKDKLESGWHRFQIYSVDMDSKWTLHCEGQITVALHSLKAEATQTWKQGALRSSDRLQPDSFTVSRRPSELYESLEKAGLKYGPTFTNITSIQAGEGSSTCEIDIARTAATMPMEFQQDHVLHPSTLDAIFQAVYTALPQSVNKAGQAMLPRSIEALAVDSDIIAEPGAQLIVFSETTKSSRQGFYSNASVSSRFADDQDRPMLELTGLFCQSLGLSQAPSSEGSNLCFSIDWKPSLPALSGESLRRLNSIKSIGERSVEQDLNFVLELLAHECPSSRLLEVLASDQETTDTGVRSLISTGAFPLMEIDTVEVGNLDSVTGSGILYDLIVVQSTPVANDTASRLREIMSSNGFLLVLDVIRAEHDVAELSVPRCRAHVLTQTPDQKWTLAAAEHDVDCPHDEDILVVHAGSRPSDEWISLLTKVIRPFISNDIQASCISVADMRDTRNKTIIFLDDPEDSVLARSDPYVYHVVQCGLIHSKNLLWISRGATMDCQNPNAALHLGLMRTLRCEYPLKRYASLDYATKAKGSEISEVPHIVEVFRRTFCTRVPLREFEYAVRDDILYLPRISEDKEENTILSGDMSQRESVPFRETDRNLRLSIEKPGLLDTLAFIDDTSVEGPVLDDYIQIKPAAFGLNFRDVMVAMGQLDEHRMGFECSGFVEAIGPKAASRGFQIGDPVYAFLRGYFANRIRVHHTSVAKVPQGMDMATAASIPLVFITAYHALHNMARIRERERVLIHSGTGGVGQAAIMLAQLARAEVFVTVGSREKQDFLVSTYGVPEDHIFNSRNASFAHGIMAATKGKGVDVVLNSLAGDLLAATWKCIAPLGRFIEIGKRNLEQNSSLEMGPFTRSVTFASLDLITLGELDGDTVADIFVQINALLRAKCIRAVSPTTTFSIAEAEKAFRTMQAGKHMGKIVLVPGEFDVVPALPRTKTISFSPDHSYLIVGGLGGIGRSIAQWMVGRGARSLILLSRSAGNQDEETTMWLENFCRAGVRVAVEACDVADEEQLALTLMNTMMRLPPIRGVIQAAMVLKDELFENMKLPSYEAAVRPKLQGSWNLHRLLPADLDFFVMLSSISGIGGNATQSNYAAGATFQDALAAFRTAEGKPTTSIDLGMVKGIGVLAGAEGQKAAIRLERIGLRALAEKEVLQLVESAVRRAQCKTSKSQMVTGIPSAWLPQANASAEELASAPFWIRDARFSQLQSRTNDHQNNRATATASLSDILDDPGVSNEEARDALSAALKSKLAVMFVVGKEDIDETMALAQLGVDSLLAVELRNWLSAASRAECSVFDVMQSSSIVDLAGRIVAKVALRANQKG